MRQVLVLKEAPPATATVSHNARKAVKVSFEYAVPQPVDVLAREVVHSFFNEDVPALKAALQNFTAAGYDPSLIHVHGDFEPDNYEALRPENLRTLLSVALLTKKPRITLMKALVAGGCDPFAPIGAAERRSHAEQAIMDENGPTSMGRRKWSWLLENTPPERWLAATTTLTGQKTYELSLVHLAVRFRKTAVVEGMVKRLGLATLDAAGPPLFEWLDHWFPANGHPAQRDARQALLDVMRPVLVTLEQNVLRETMDQHVPKAVTSATSRARL